jgi:hypothetical protein
MTKLEKMQRAVELSEAAQLLDQIGGPEAELLTIAAGYCFDHRCRVRRRRRSRFYMSR